MARPLCFDGVVFDLDGTLVATDRFWIESAERGARRAFEALGLRRELPSPTQWLSLVGLPLEVGFRALFPELSEGERRTVLQACVQEEELLLEQGGVPTMPGARALLERLASAGLKLGIASNCQSSYLERMQDGLGLRALGVRAYCRESPGVESKGEMLARLIADFGTRSLVMVGDRSSDRDAAWENGLPHVHCAFGFAQGDEAVEAEGRIGALAELEGLLERRGRWIERALERLGALRRPGMRIGITGGPRAGKSLFARDAARVLAAQGHPVAALSLTDFPARAPARDADALEARVDLTRLEAEVLRPHEAGRPLVLARADLLGQREVPPGATLLLEGPFLLGAKWRASLDRLVHLDLPRHVAEQRAGRERAAQARVEEEWLLGQALERRFPPRAAADLVLDGTNPLGTGLEARLGARASPG